MKIVGKKLAITSALILASVAFVCAAEVNALWDKHCVSCHAKDGSGNTKMGKKGGSKDYRNPAVQAEMKDDAALKALQDGITDKGKERMKSYKDKLSEDEMKALVAHMRTFKK